MERCRLLGCFGTMLSRPTGKHVLSATWILAHKHTRASTVCLFFSGGNLEMDIFFFGYSRQMDQCALGELILQKQHKPTFMDLIRVCVGALARLLGSVN